jgi:hypothetical protein
MPRRPLDPSVRSPRQPTTRTNRKAKGRPSLIEVGYNPGTGEWSPSSPAGRILLTIRNGAFLTTACGFARVNRSTVHRWLATGREHWDVDKEYDRAEVDPAFRPYVDFCVAMDHSDATAHVTCDNAVMKNIREGDWRAAISFMRLRWPEQYTTRSTVEADVRVSEPTGEPVDGPALLHLFHTNPRLADLADELDDVLALGEQMEA